MGVKLDDAVSYFALRPFADWFPRRDGATRTPPTEDNLCAAPPNESAGSSEKPSEQPSVGIVLGASGLPS
jgi:hypothetical protein